MFLLDTNVISELMKTKPEPKVLAWVDQQLDYAAQEKIDALI